MKHIRPVITIDELLKKLRSAFRRNGREKSGLLALRGGEIAGFFLDAGGKRYPGACALSIPPLIRRPEGWRRRTVKPA